MKLRRLRRIEISRPTPESELSSYLVADCAISVEKDHYNLACRRCLESVASGYWTPSVKRSSGLSQPLGFESLTLRSHSTIRKRLDTRASRVMIGIADGVQYHVSAPAGYRGFRIFGNATFQVSLDTPGLRRPSQLTRRIAGKSAISPPNP